MKILHVITNTTFNIYYQTLIGLLQALQKSNIEQEIICDSETANSSFSHITCSYIQFIQNIFGFNIKLFIKINNFNPDIIITWGEPARKFIGNTKYTHISFVESISNIKSFSMCDYIFTNSENILTFLKRNGWSGNRSIYIPPLIQNRDSKQITKKDLFIPEHSKVVFSSIAFFKAINIAPLFSAISIIPDLYLILAGHGPNIKEVRETATKIGVKPRVRIINNLDNVDNLIQMSEFAILPFFDVEMNFPILLSFKNKKLVITEENYLTKEIIKDKYNGIVIQSHDYTNISSVIQTNLIDKLNHTDLINQAFKDYENNYSEEKILKYYINTFQKIVEDCKTNTVL